MVEAVAPSMPFMHFMRLPEVLDLAPQPVLTGNSDRHTGSVEFRWSLLADECQPGECLS